MRDICIDNVCDFGGYKVTMFHLSMTFVLSFSIKYSSLKLSKCCRMSALFLMKMLCLGRHLRLREMLISINIVL